MYASPMVLTFSSRWRSTSASKAEKTSFSTPTSSAARERRGQSGELDDVGEEQGHVVEAIGDQRLAVAQSLRDRLGQDVQQQPLVLTGQAFPLP